jgi:hypothetical protein
MAEEQHVYTHPSRVEHWRHLIEIIALSAAAIWALYVFVYQERIKPANSSPSLEVSPVVTHTAMRNGKELVTVDLDQKNIGPVDLQIDANLVNVRGLRYGNALTRSQETEHHRVTLFNAVPQKASVMVMSSLRMFRPFGQVDTNVFQPGREKRPSRTFVLPANTYDAVQIDYATCYQRADDRSVRNVSIQKTADGAFDLDAVAALENGTTIFCPWGNTIVAL